MSAPTTRLSTALAADCRSKYVLLPAGIEKPCQWMIDPGELVILRLLVPRPCICTLPCMTCGVVGFANAGATLKQLLTATAMGRTSQNFLFTGHSPARATYHGGRR